jgi:ferritin
MEKPILKINTLKPSLSTYKGGLSQKMQDLINWHIEAEGFSSQIYLAMSAWLDPKGYTGAAKFFRKHAEEERKHMMKLYDFMSDKNCIAVTPMLKQPDTEYTDLLDILETALKHEYEVTAGYERDCEVALSEPSHQVFELFQWFIREQVEEEALYRTILDKYLILAQGGITGVGLMQMDEILGELAE